MKKRLNIVFFSICFLAALLAEAYCIQILKGDLFSVVGIGIVVLITGFLLLDSLRSIIIQSREGVKSYLDQIYIEETNRWSERYTELVNLQKATYTASKKNTAMVAEQFENLQIRLENLEDNYTKTLQKIAELQKKSMEGQKNALNLEINYNKENAKSLISVLREEGNSQSEQFSKIIELLEKNSILLNKRTNVIENTEFGFDIEKPEEQITAYQNDDQEEETITQVVYEELDIVDHINEDQPEKENASEPNWILEEEPKPEAEYTDNVIKETSASTVVKPLYDDPNKALTADEIASLFSSFGQ